MEFVLKPDNRNSSDEDLIGDLKRVANDLWKSYISREEYDKYWRYSEWTLRKRFWGWINTLGKAGMNHLREYDISKEDLILEINRIAKLLNKNSITREEFTINKQISNSAKVEKLFWTWSNAIKESGLTIERIQKRNSEEDYFENLFLVWSHYGRQPTITEMWELPSIISWKSYSYRFWNYRKALEAFVDYINKENIEQQSPTEDTWTKITYSKTHPEKIETKHKTGRTINWRLRFIVMKRDNFKCKGCGRNPATNPNIILHVDHIKAWANWGETVLENLQTLCSVCNIGKSDLE